MNLIVFNWPSDRVQVTTILEEMDSYYSERDDLRRNTLRYVELTELIHQTAGHVSGYDMLEHLGQLSPLERAEKVTLRSVAYIFEFNGLTGADVRVDNEPTDADLNQSGLVGLLNNRVPEQIIFVDYSQGQLTVTPILAYV